MAESSLEAQARRALASAEQRFLAGDVAGARRYAQDALNLAPGLHGAEQALVAYDVHAAAPDWYAVLGLGLPHPRPSGDQSVVTHDDIKRQHRRLCLLVHPDKNPSAAADGAFKIVQAAYDDAMRVAEAAARTAWEEEAAVTRFWQTVADDVIITPAPPAPKQPPIARPPPRWAAPATGPGPPRQPPPQPPSWAQGAQTPQRAPAPSNFYASQPTRAGKPYCPYYPFCVGCRLYAATAPMSGKPYCPLYPFCVCCRL